MNSTTGETVGSIISELLKTNDMYILCNEYQKLAHVTSGFNSVENGQGSNMHLAMCTFGIIGEYFEGLNSLTFTASLDTYGLDEKFEDAKLAVMAEMGDCLWYIAEMCTWANIPFRSVYFAALSCESATIFDIGALAESVKKYVFHNKVHGFDPMRFLPCILAEILAILKELDIELYFVLNGNIKKLQGRHAGTFNGLANLTEQV